MERNGLKFVVDSRYFDGCCITSMSDGIHNDYGGHETLEELKERENNPHLTAVSENTIRKMAHIHDRSLCAPFKEITEKEYYDKLDVLPPVRYTKHFFFIGEPYSGDIYPFCFNMDGRYFTGLRSVRTPRKELERQMAVHYDNMTFRAAIQKEESFIMRPEKANKGILLIIPYLFIDRNGEKKFIANTCFRPGDGQDIENARKCMARILLSLRRHHFLYFSDDDKHDDLDSFLDRIAREKHTLSAKGTFFQYPTNHESVSFGGNVKETGENFFYRIYDRELFLHLMCRLRGIKRETEK